MDRDLGGKMQQWLYSILLLTMTNLTWAEQMLVLRENAEEKQIWQQTSNGEFLPLPDLPKISIYPSISRDARWIAFSGGESLQNSFLRLHLRDQLTGHSLVLPLENHEHVYQTHISANAKWVVFSALHKQSRKVEVLRYHIEDQSTEIILSSPEASFFFPSLSSDGEYLLVQARYSQRSRKILRYHLSSKNTQEISAADSNCMAPRASFDDRFVAFVCKNTEGHWQLFERDLRTNSLQLLSLSPKQSDYSPQYTASGDLIYASPRQTPYFALYKRLRARDGQLTSQETLLLKQAQHSLYAPSFSGDLRFRQSYETDMPQPARSSFGAIVYKDALYIAGGHMGREHTYPPESFSDQLQRYSFTTKNWETLAPRPVKAQGYALSRCGDYLYAFGGFAYSGAHRPGWQSLNFVDRYDPRSNQWQRLAPMPRARSSHAAIELNDKIYLVGGWNSTPKFDNDIDGHFHREIDVFDCASEKFVTSSLELPGPKRRAFTGIAYKNRLLLIGGISEGGSVFSLLDRVDWFDPASGQNTELPPLPFASFAPAAGAIGEDVFVFGGMFQFGTWEYNYVNHIYRFDGSHWQHTGRHLKTTKGFSQVSLRGSQLVIAGGHTYEGGVDEPVVDVETWEFNP